MEIEELVKVVLRPGISKTEIPEAEDSLNRLQDAAKIAVLVADVTRLRRISRNHEQRHPEASLIVLLAPAFFKDGWNMVVPAAPIVPRNEDGGVFPIAGAVVAVGIVADGIHDRRYPRGALPAVDGMIRILPRRCKPS